MEETKAVLYGNVSSDFYSGLSGTPTGFQIYETGRYGIIPVIPAWGTRAEVTEKLIQEADKLGVTPPNVLDVKDKNLSGQAKQKYFKDLYPIEYVGNAFADKWEAHGISTTIKLIQMKSSMQFYLWKGKKKAHV